MYGIESALVACSLSVLKVAPVSVYTILLPYPCMAAQRDLIRELSPISCLLRKKSNRGRVVYRVHSVEHYMISAKGILSIVSDTTCVRSPQTLPFLCGSGSGLRACLH